MSTILLQVFNGIIDRKNATIHDFNNGISEYVQYDTLSPMDILNYPEEQMSSKQLAYFMAKEASVELDMATLLNMVKNLEQFAHIICNWWMPSWLWQNSNSPSLDAVSHAFGGIQSILTEHTFLADPTILQPDTYVDSDIETISRMLHKHPDVKCYFIKRPWHNDNIPKIDNMITCETSNSALGLIKNAIKEANLTG
jgi:hypothetical protein